MSEAKQHLLDCLKGYKSEGDGVGVTLALRDLGSLSAQSGTPAEALSYFGRALANISAAKKPEIVADIRARRALALRDLHRVAEARSTLQETLRFWSNRHHERWIALSLFQLGTVETAAGNFAKANSLFKDSKTLYLKVGDAPGVHMCEGWMKGLTGSAPAFAGRSVTS